MQYFTYPDSLGPIEARFVKAVNLYYQEPSIASANSIAFLLYSDSAKDSETRKLREALVWEIMSGPVCQVKANKQLPLGHWIYWWRQRWATPGKVADFHGMYEVSRRGICLQIARLAQMDEHTDTLFYVEHLSNAVEILLSRGDLYWHELVSIAQALPLNCSFSRAQTIEKPSTPSFAIAPCAWNFLWTLTIIANEEKAQVVSALSNLVHTVEEFGEALNAWYSSKCTRPELSLPSNLLV